MKKITQLFTLIGEMIRYFSSVIWRVEIKDMNGDMLEVDEKVNKRWAKYFEDLLKVEDD